MEDSEDQLEPTTHHSRNIAVDEIDQETVSKLKGDAIGNTMYSEVFVLNTLLQFSDLKWSSEVEDNLCFLWDMTEEKDVCQYLLQASYPSLACSAIQNYSEPRFLEIVVGIFANLLCSDCEKNISQQEIKVVLDLLHSDDPYILTQVMRFVHAVSFMFQVLDFIEEEYLKRFDFILSNSTNKELLSNCLKALSSITSDMKVQKHILKSNLLLSSVTAYRSLKCDSVADSRVFETQEEHIHVKHLIQILCNMCGYVDRLDLVDLSNELNVDLHEFTSEIVILLQCYVEKDNLLPIRDEFKFYIEALTYIYRVLRVPYISLVAKILFQIVAVLCKSDPWVQGLRNLESVGELFCYFISVGSLEEFKKDFENVSPAEVKNVLSYIEKQSFKFEFDYVCKLKKISDEL